MATLRRSAIANATMKRTLSIDTGILESSPRVGSKELSTAADMVHFTDSPVSGASGSHRWDEARVGVEDYQVGEGNYRLSRLVKLGVATARRRSRRTVFCVISFFSLLAFLSISSHPLLADVTHVSGLGTNGSAPFSDMGSEDGRSFRLRLMDCLSFKDCPWLFGDASQARAQILAADAEYLGPEHLATPRLAEPYPDMNKWSIAKKEKTLQGLEWLITHYNNRWRPEPDLKAARRFNQDVFTRLRDCIEMSMSPSKFRKRSAVGEKPLTCSPEEMTVVMLGSYHFGAVYIGWVSGEDIWARSMTATLDDLGYSTLYAYDTIEIYDIYRAIPDLVQIIVAQTSNIRECYEHGVLEKALSEPSIRQGARISYVLAQAGDSHELRNHTLAEWTDLEEDGQTARWKNPVFYGHPRLYGQRLSDSPDALDPESPDYEPHQEWRCAQAPDFPQGVPLWKMFGFHFWENTDEHPLGAQWTLSPEPYATFPSIKIKQPEFNLYTGYSVEGYCGDVVPAEERAHRAYILAKVSDYLEPPRFTFSNHVFNDMKEEMGFEFVAGIEKLGSALPDPGITNLGFMTLAQFRRELGHSKVLVGVGRPRLSPTPYDALCMGVPFINSIIDWDEDNPDDQSAWYPQHEGLINVGKPYVYNVRLGNETELKDAIAKAFANPIERFIPRRMSKPALKARHRFLVEADWKAVYDKKFGGEQA